ncbi:MAG: HAD family hydrolase [Actinomycetota bacterium]
MASRRYDIVCFDLDGTLLPSTTTVLHLSRWNGTEAAFAELERRYAAGEISNTEVARADAANWAGVAVADVHRALEDAVLIEGVQETVATLTEHGIDSYITTLTWRFAAEYFAARYGFAGVTGCELTTDEHGVLGGVLRLFEAPDKVEFARRICTERGIGPERCVAVGDSQSDLPLFGFAGLSIALNATPDARAAADVVLDTDDLRDVLGYIVGPAAPPDHA